MRALYFDTETSGFVRDPLPLDDPSQPWIVQLAALLADEDRVWASLSVVIRADGREMPEGAAKVHGYDAKLADEVGVTEADAAAILVALFVRAEHLVSHNLTFDLERVTVMLNRRLPWMVGRFRELPGTCTMKSGAPVCRLGGRHRYRRFGEWKWPKLGELHQHLFGEGFEGQHDALADVMATRRCHLELLRLEREGELP